MTTEWERRVGRPLMQRGGNNKTPASQVSRMQSLRNKGWTPSEIAREFNVCRDTVYRRTTAPR